MSRSAYYGITCIMDFCHFWIAECYEVGDSFSVRGGEFTEEIQYRHVNATKSYPHFGSFAADAVMCSNLFYVFFNFFLLFLHVLFLA